MQEAESLFVVGRVEIVGHGAAFVHQRVMR